MKVEGSVFLAVEINTPLHKLTDLLGSVAHNLLHRFGLAQPVAGHHRVMDMLFKIVYFKICHRGHTALCKSRICLFKRCFAHKRDFHAGTGYLQGETHARYTRTYNKIIIFESHIIFFLASQI